MKTDAEYLTEHVIGDYSCPCDPKPRRVKKQFVPGSGRHIHTSDADTHDCIARELTRKIKYDLSEYPLAKLVQQIVLQHGLPAELSLLKRSSHVFVCQENLTKALVLISKQRNLHRTKSQGEMVRASGVFSGEIVSAAKDHLKDAFFYGSPPPDIIPKACHLKLAQSTYAD